MIKISKPTPEESAHAATMFAVHFSQMVAYLPCFTDTFRYENKKKFNLFLTQTQNFQKEMLNPLFKKEEIEGIEEIGALFSRLANLAKTDEGCKVLDTINEVLAGNTKVVDERQYEVKIKDRKTKK